LETEDRKGIYLRMVEWKSIKKDMRKLLNYPIELKIKGADEYLNSLDGLFNYIDAYIEAKIEEMESFKEHSRIKLQIEMFKKKETRLKKMIAVCEEKQNNYDEIEFLLFERLINTRFRKTIHEQIEDRNNIKREMETTLTRFKDNFITFEITLDHKEFSKSERVRLNQIKVFLKGVGSDGDIIFLHISNTGMFADKYEGDKYSFRSELMRPKAFRYEVPNNIKTKALFASEDYIVPTHLVNGPLSSMMI
ncbi:19879_t:CDS:2, partial [Gigaspora rosea]